MKNFLNRKKIAFLALVATFVLPVVALAADDPASAGSGGWIVTGVMIIVFFVLGTAILTVGVGLGAAMLGYKMGKSDEE